MNRRDSLRQLGALGATVASTVWSTPLRAQALPIVIGQSAALSGPARALGMEFRLGAQLVFAALNERGGIAGRRVDLRSLDDGYEPERCAANTRELLGAGALALFGYIGTPTSLAALPLATEARVPFIAPFTGAEALRAPFNRYAFHVRASYFDETAEIIRQVTTLGKTRIGVFYQDDSYGKAGLEGVTRALKTHNLEPAGLGTVQRNTVDVDAAVKTLVAAQPEAIVQISAYRSCAAFVRAARKAGFGGVFYNVSFVGTKALADELGAEARGVVVSQVMPYPYSTARGVADEYLAAGRAAYGDKFMPNYSSIEGFIAARTLVEGLRRAGPRATPEALVNALEGLREFNLGGYFVDFSARKHTGSKFVELTMLTGDGRVLR